jgi:hypothetical protein
MDEPITADTQAEPLDNPPATVEETCSQYLGRWNRLVSTTNWEKGRIIHEWRQALYSAGAPSALYADEAWSRRVGNVSPQHVGRLRRVHERFAQVAEKFPGLYWSHFQAALDWEDAEMWLEGAVQNQWSVAAMRNQRWETMGAVPDQQPKEEEIVDGEPDEDAGPVEADPPATIGQTPAEVQDLDGETAEVDDEGPEVVPFDEPQLVGDQPATVPPLQPFAEMPKLPADLAEPFEALKLAIVQHKLTGWQEISRDELLAALDALRQLAMAPAG